MVLNTPACADRTMADDRFLVHEQDEHHLLLNGLTIDGEPRLDENAPIGSLEQPTIQNTTLVMIEGEKVCDGRSERWSGLTVVICLQRQIHTVETITVIPLFANLYFQRMLLASSIIIQIGERRRSFLLLGRERATLMVWTISDGRVGSRQRGGSRRHLEDDAQEPDRRARPFRAGRSRPGKRSSPATNDSCVVASSPGRSRR